ncbi:MAG: hypothetical protein IJH43_03705 [Mogibacterium sp.]|nr:hypothetical protein [Mogibacterium sp.]
MGILEQISNGMNTGREQFRRIMSETEAVTDKPELGSSQLALGDNTDYMKSLIRQGYSGAFRLIYIDPPFFTRSKFNATVSVKDASGKGHRIRHLVFDDRFERSLECYIENLSVRILLMKELLADDGLLWIHLDWHSSHYVKLILDELMSEKNFVNEIIWCYKSGGSGKKHFSRKHDTILVYSKTKKYYIDIPEEKSYNRGFKPYNFKGVREYCDERGWYTLVNMKDVWNVDMVGRTSYERTGYATQKPLELMNRIIKAGSREGDLVGDFFCGSGSFLESAENLGRKWAGCDNEKLAVSMARKRLVHSGADFEFIQNDGEAREHGRISLIVSEAQDLESGRRLLKCKLDEFVPDIETGYIQTADRKYIEEVIEQDPMQLVDHIIVYGEDGISSIIEDDFDDMTIVCDRNAEIVAVDVFGREYVAEIMIDGGIGRI